MPLSGLSEGGSHGGHRPVECGSGGIFPPPPPGIAQALGLKRSIQMGGEPNGTVFKPG